MYSASVIAYAFVKKGIADSRPVTQMKLQKLVYFAHGLYLAQHNKPLVADYFEAWKYGPVAPLIYRVFKNFGSEVISDINSLPEKDFLELMLQDLPKEVTNVIDTTWTALKDVDPIRLSNWTHNQDSAWSKVYKENIESIPINNSDIKAYFERFKVPAHA